MQNHSTANFQAVFFIFICSSINKGRSMTLQLLSVTLYSIIWQIILFIMSEKLVLDGLNKSNPRKTTAPLSLGFRSLRRRREKHPKRTCFSIWGLSWPISFWPLWLRDHPERLHSRAGAQLTQTPTEFQAKITWNNYIYDIGLLYCQEWSRSLQRLTCQV